MKGKAQFVIRNAGGANLLVPLGAQVMNGNGLIILNDTAACVWELLGQERSLDDLTSAVAKQFGVAAGIARDDVQNFVDEISALGLLE